MKSPIDLRRSLRNLTVDEKARASARVQASKNPDQFPDQDGESISRRARSSPRRTKRRRILKWLGISCAVLMVVGGVARALLPWFARDYVNRTLDRSPTYAGEIGKIHVHLWRGAYSIEEVRLNKKTGNVPVPFFSARRVDFALQWSALLHRRVVGRVVMVEPQINFVDAGAEGEGQTGAGGGWLQMIRDLFPFKINGAQVKNGSIHFRTYRSTQRWMFIFRRSKPALMIWATSATNPLRWWPR
jgi:hypothetical protein